jgi:ribonuclease BN (tRNA processing enzyme)
MADGWAGCCAQHGTDSGDDEGDGHLRWPDATTMRIQVLGASGGIGNGARTTSLRVDHDVLIDAGTGVADLSLDEMMAIDHVFLTHAHLDHVTCIPFLLDSVGSRRAQPLTVHAQEATLAVLRQHLFNNALWPDFTAIPSRDRPFLRFEPLSPGDTASVRGRRFRSVPVAHTIPAVGYLVDSGKSTLAFSGDTTTTDEYWRVLNGCDNLAQVIIETSFLDEEEALSRISGHLCPRLVAIELAKLTRAVPIYITHLMPGEDEAIMAEIHRHVPDRPVQALRAGMKFEL